MEEASVRAHVLRQILGLPLAPSVVRPVTATGRSTSGLGHAGHHAPSPAPPPAQTIARPAD